MPRFSATLRTASLGTKHASTCARGCECDAGGGRRGSGGAAAEGGCYLLEEPRGMSTAKVGADGGKRYGPPGLATLLPQDLQREVLAERVQRDDKVGLVVVDAALEARPAQDAAGQGPGLLRGAGRAWRRLTLTHKAQRAAQPSGCETATWGMPPGLSQPRSCGAVIRFCPVHGTSRNLVLWYKERQRYGCLQRNG